MDKLQQESYRKFSMDEISPNVRELAVTWIENYKPIFDISDKLKLANDIQNIVHNEKIRFAIERLEESKAANFYYNVNKKVNIYIDIKIQELEKQLK